MSRDKTIVEKLPYDEKLNDFLQDRLRGYVPIVSSAVDYTVTDGDYFVEISADKGVTLPEATTALKGKSYIIYFSAAATSGGGIVDDAGTPNTLVAQTLCIDESAFMLICNGTAWRVLNIGAVA